MISVLCFVRCEAVVEQQVSKWEARGVHGNMIWNRFDMMLEGCYAVILMLKISNRSHVTQLNVKFKIQFEKKWILLLSLDCLVQKASFSIFPYYLKIFNLVSFSVPRCYRKQWIMMNQLTLLVILMNHRDPDWAKLSPQRLYLSLPIMFNYPRCAWSYKG